MSATLDRPKTRWFQFSLRTLLVAMLALGVALVPVAYERQKANREKRALELIHKLGGATNFGADSSRSDWQRLLLGDDAPGKVTCVELGGDPVTDAHLAQLADLPNIQRLSLSRAQITDSGLVHFRRLSKLRTLSLDESQVSDAGLDSLAHLSSLEWLSLYNTRVTDAGVQKLQRALPNLSVIDAHENERPPINAPGSPPH